jgi:hypothetical protein
VEAIRTADHRKIAIFETVLEFTKRRGVINFVFELLATFGGRIISDHRDTELPEIARVPSAN